MSEPMFSVIVPIYGVEKYLEQCIKSILEQDFDDFELILVDDGSRDRCPKIIDEYAKKDARIKVIHKKNEGLVRARNSGLMIAKGEYIVNVDGDDYMIKGALRCLWDNICQTHADVYLFGFIIGDDTGSTAEIPNIPKGLYDDGDSKRALYEKIIYDPEKPFFAFGTYPSVWSRIVKRELFSDVRLKIDKSLDIGEDFATTLPIMLKAETIFFIPEPLYYYRIVGSSASHKFNINEMKFFASMLEGFEKGGIDISLYNIKNQLGAYAVYVFYNYLYEYILMTDDYKEYKERIRKTDEIIFRYIGYARYNFKDKRSVIMMGIMKNRLWRILWIYAKKKGRKRYDGKE